MQSSPTFERQGVREIGHRCFFQCSTGFTLGNGETSANFQIFGRRCSWKETGKANSSTYSLRSQFGILSGPPLLEGFSVDSGFIILSSDTSDSFGESAGIGILVSSCSRGYSLSGSRNAWLIMSQVPAYCIH